MRGRIWHSYHPWRFPINLWKRTSFETRQQYQCWACHSAMTHTRTWDDQVRTEHTNTKGWLAFAYLLHRKHRTDTYLVVPRQMEVIVANSDPLLDGSDLPKWSSHGFCESFCIYSSFQVHVPHFLHLHHPTSCDGYSTTSCRFCLNVLDLVEVFVEQHARRRRNKS